MKLLDDLSIFDNDYLPLIDSGKDGREYYYRRNNRDVKAFYLNYSQEELFYAITLFEMNSLGGTHYRRNGAEFFSIEFVQEGQLHVRQDKRGYLLEAGDLFLMQPGAQTEYLIYKEDFCIKTSIALSGLLLPEFLTKSGLGEKDVLEAVDKVRLTEILSHFKILSNKESGNLSEENSRQTYQLLQFLRNPAPASIATDKIRLAVEHMKKHMDKALTIGLLSDLTGYSPPHFMRSFREIYGQSPHQFLLRLRMKQASLLLLNEQKLTVKEIASRVGYPRPLNFSAEFRHRYGLSPLQYRRHYCINSILPDSIDPI